MNLYNTFDKLINCIIFRLIEENPMLIYPQFSKKLIKIQVSFTFLNLRRFSVGPNFEKFCVDILFIDLQAFLKNMSHYMLVVFVVTFCWGPFSTWKSARETSVSGDVKQCSKHGYITHHGLWFCLQFKYYYTELGHTVVMNIWNVDARQRQTYPTWADFGYIMSVSSNLYYLLISIVLLSQDRNHKILCQM